MSQIDVQAMIQHTEEQHEEITRLRALVAELRAALEGLYDAVGESHEELVNAMEKTLAALDKE